MINEIKTFEERKQELVKKGKEKGCITYEELANAVVLQAVKDYRTAVKHLKLNHKNEAAIKMKAECECFFISQHFSTFTSIDGKSLLAQLEKEE